MTLPVLPAGKLPVRAPAQHWLVEQLWSAEAVGIIGGEPKCGKSLLVWISTAEKSLTQI